MVGESSGRRSWIGAGILFILEGSCEKKAQRWWRGKRKIVHVPWFGVFRECQSMQRVALEAIKRFEAADLLLKLVVNTQEDRHSQGSED